MYDFFLGSAEEIQADPGTYLMGIKRMLPRWANSLPDSEYSLLIEFMDSYVPKENPVFVETGVGASTILFIHYAMERNGRVISWDTNSSKASFIRSVCADTLDKIHGKTSSAHWTFIPSMSTASYTGMEILGELTDYIDLTHHDSDHTWATVGAEIEATLPLLSEGALVCVDDANQLFQHTYEPIINMTRRKIGLPPIAPIDGNTGDPLIEKIPNLLQSWFGDICEVSGGFRKKLHDDLYYDWYDLDRRSMNEVGMERFAQLSDRFAAWRLNNRKQS
jgi:hypothetical protein